MRFKVSPFSHRDYSALLERNESLATLWGLGHIGLGLSVAIAVGAPLALTMAAMINPETTTRARDVGVRVAFGIQFCEVILTSRHASYQHYSMTRKWPNKRTATKPAMTTPLQSKIKGAGSLSRVR